MAQWQRPLAGRVQGLGRPGRHGAWQRQRARLQTSSRGSPPRSQLDASDAKVPQPRKSAQLEPSFWLNAEDAVTAQLKALQHNSFPYGDHGVECMYKFTAFDPFARSDYFGRSLDLGQFERFRRIFYTPRFVTLLNHSRHSVLSTLDVSESVWKARVLVENERRKEEQVYEFTMVQRFGGRRDGYWFTEKLLPDADDGLSSIYGVI